MKAIINSDASCHVKVAGGTAPMRIGYVIKTEKGRVLALIGQYVGEGTNNVAEYMSLNEALRHTARLGFEYAEARVDSQLIVRQLSGQYSVKNLKIKALLAETRRLSTLFKKVDVIFVGRENNTEADELTHRSTFIAPALSFGAWQARRIREWRERTPELTGTFFSKVFAVDHSVIGGVIRGETHRDSNLDTLPVWDSLDDGGWPDKADVEELTGEPEQH